MPVDPASAARAWELVHERRFSLAQTARALGCGTHDVGEMLSAHKVVLDAEAQVRAIKATVPVTDDFDPAAVEAAHRERVLATARKLIAADLDLEAIGERLGVSPRTLSDLPEAKARHAERTAESARARAAPAETSAGPRVRFVPREWRRTPDAARQVRRAADAREQEARDGWR